MCVLIGVRARSVWTTPDKKINARRVDAHKRTN